MNDHQSNCPCVPCHATRLLDQVQEAQRESDRWFVRLVVVSGFVFVAALVLTSVLKGVSP